MFVSRKEPHTIFVYLTEINIIATLTFVLNFKTLNNFKETTSSNLEIHILMLIYNLHLWRAHLSVIAVSCFTNKLHKI